MALLVFGVPYGALTLSTKPEPELRVIRTGDTLGGLLIDGQARMLILGTGDPREANAALGRLAGPLEDSVTTLVAAADDKIVAGLFEALQQSSPAQVLILGVPGADPTWAAIEDV